MKKDRDKYFSFYKENRFLRYKQFFLERDILRVAFYLFEAEKKLKKDGFVDRIAIPLSSQTFQRIDRDKLKEVLEELFLLILLEDVKIDLIEIEDMKSRVTKKVTFPQKEAVILFSAGVDSYSGIKVAENYHKQLMGLFIAHNDQAWVIKIVAAMKPLINTEIKTLYAPPMGSTGYSQLRGFLYILSGGVYLNLCKTDKIIVTECGPTMYQPLFSPFDSITYTTHPYVLKAAKDALTILLGFEPKIIIPFEDLTKAEVISNSGIKDFSTTHSCISQRFGDHDGTCFGCVIKKLACQVGGVKDVSYNKNIFNGNANQDNLLNLLNFSDDLLNNYKTMPAFQKEKIEEFKKRDLFERYALDNIAGLMMGADNQSQIYKKFINSNQELFGKRIAQVREKPKAPDFGRIIN